MQSLPNSDMSAYHTSGETSNRSVSGGQVARACDHCRARKIRCDRVSLDGISCSSCIKANIICDASVRSTRVNHTKKLVDDFASMGSRLDNIDAILYEMSSSLRQNQTLTTPMTRPPSASSFTYDLAELQHFCRDVPPPLSLGQSGSKFKGHHSVCNKGFAWYHGPTAMLSLFHSSRNTFASLLSGRGVFTDSPPSDSSSDLHHLRDENTVKFVLWKIIAAFPFQDAITEIQLSPGRSAISRPPRKFLDASIGFYFCHINSCMPLFNECNLRSRIDEAYRSTAGQSEEAHNLCFNNIILLTLGAKLRFDRTQSSHQNIPDNRVFLSLFNNACLAAGSLDSLQNPNIVHIQALASLALVGADYFSEELFDKIVTVACRLASVAGLREAAGSDHDTAQDEHRKLFWSLYCLDKRCVFLMGRPCDVYLFDSAIELPSCDLDHMVNKCTSAQLHLMTIWEQISISLYSHRAQRQDSSIRTEQVTRLDELCEAWKSQYEYLLADDAVDSGGSNGAHYVLELRYYYLHTQVLIHRCGETAESRQKAVVQSRAALNILVDLHRSNLTLDGAAVLARLFRYLPPLPFHHIVEQATHSSSDNGDDVFLLSDTMDALSPLLQPSMPKAYANQLHAGMTWCNIMVKMFRKFDEKNVLQDDLQMPKDVPTSSVRGAALDSHGTANAVQQSPNGHRSDSTLNAKRQKRVSAAVRKHSDVRPGRSMGKPRNRRRHAQRQTSSPKPTKLTSSSLTGSYFPSHDHPDCSNLDLEPNWDAHPMSPWDMPRGREDYDVLNAESQTMDCAQESMMGLPREDDPSSGDGYNSFSSCPVNRNPMDVHPHFQNTFDSISHHDSTAGHQIFKCPAPDAIGLTNQSISENMWSAEARYHDQLSGNMGNLLDGF